jgi:hypothetical protein
MSAGPGSPDTELTIRLVVNKVKCLDVIFDKRITWELHTEMFKFKVCRIFVNEFIPFSKVGDYAKT